MKIVALDPGISTGVAVWENNEMTSYQFSSGLLYASDFVGNLLEPYDVLVYEKFIIMASTIKKDLEGAYRALYLNGNALTAAERKHCRIIQHRPSDKEWGLPLLAGIGWHRTGKDVRQPDADDANVAAAHLLKYLTDSRQLPSELLAKLIDLEFN